MKLALAKNWLAKLQTKATGWNIPATATQDLTAKVTSCDTLLTQDLSADRTKTITAQCKAAFDDLEAFMRDFKRRYFFGSALAGHRPGLP